MVTALWVVGTCVLAVLGLVLGMIAIGAQLPVAHVATRRARIAAPIDAVFARLTEVEKAPTWRADVRAVAVIAPAPLRWKETTRHGEIEFEAPESAAPTRFVSRIASVGLPFGGRWEHVLASDGSETIVTITEHGEVRPPIFRFLSRYVFGHTATMDGVLRALARSFGGEARIETP